MTQVNLDSIADVISEAMQNKDMLKLMLNTKAQLKPRWNKSLKNDTKNCLKSKRKKAKLFFNKKLQIPQISRVPMVYKMEAKSTLRFAVL